MAWLFGGGGSDTSKVEIPKWLEKSAKYNISRSKDVSRIGYAPYYGPDVAALTAGNKASMDGTNQMASAFGMPTFGRGAGMPAVGHYKGMKAYSAGPMYDAALRQLRLEQPKTYAKLKAPFRGGNKMGGATPTPAPDLIAGTASLLGDL